MAIIYFSSLMGMILASLFSKGLYFDHDFQGYHVVIQLLFLLLLIRELLYKENVTTSWYGLFVMSVLYTIPALLYPERIPVIFEGVKRVTSYVSVFIMFIFCFKHTPSLKKYLPHGIHSIGVTLVGHMILVDVGFIHDPFAVSSNDFAGLLEYPNTFGAIMAMLVLFALIDLQSRSSIHTTSLNILMLLFYSYMLVESGSRGAIVAFSITFLSYLFTIPSKNQIKAILILLLNILFVFIVLWLRAQYGTGVSYVGLVIIPMLFLTLWIKCTGNHYVNIEITWPPYLLPSFLIVAIVTFISSVITRAGIFNWLPLTVQNQLVQWFQFDSFYARLTYYHDAFKILSESPWVGLGRGAWQANYQAVQSDSYLSNEIHNGFLTIVLETGWIGFIVMAFVVLSISYSIYQSNRVIHLYLWPMWLIVIHSAIDFNFSYGSIWFLIILLIAPMVSDVLPFRCLSREGNTVSRKTVTIVMFGLAVSYSLFTILY